MIASFSTVGMMCFVVIGALWRPEYRPMCRDWPVPPRASCDCVWVSLPLSNNTDSLGGGLNVTNRFLNIACIYIPHGSKYRDALISFVDLVGQVIIDRPNDLFLITGDFNIPEANWVVNPNSGINLATAGTFGTKLIHDFMSFSGTKQYNSIVNTNGRILDLVFFNSNCIVISCDSPLITEDAHHRSLLIDFRLNCSSHLNPTPHFV